MKHDRSPLRAKSLRFLCGITVCCLMAGCSATTTFTPYPAKINPYIADLQENRPVSSQFLADECRSRDRLLYSLERGRIRQILGQTDPSLEDFRLAMEEIRAKDEQALLSVSAATGQVAAVMVNDNALSYQAAGYERVMLHHYQALNYLASHDLEGAGVEIRLATAEQDEALRRHEREEEKAREAADRKFGGWNPDEVMTAYAGMDEIAGQVKNSFQNAYTFYLSAIVYEMLGQSDFAYIDYRKALEIAPDNLYLQQDVLRLAETQAAEDLSLLHQRFPEASVQRPLPGEGEVILLFEDDFVPQLKEIKIPLPIIDLRGRIKGTVAVAFPYYPPENSPSRRLTLSCQEREIGSTVPITDARILAMKALKEKMFPLIVRQVLRTSAKALAASEAKKRLGALGEIGASLYNLVSENADLRSWITLPAQAQIMRVTLPAGRQRLSLALPGTGTGREVEIDIPENGTTILHVVGIGRQLYSSIYSLPALAQVH